jgi:hypothetical protein
VSLLCRPGRALDCRDRCAFYTRRAVPYTNGFRDVNELRRHFFAHGGPLGCASTLAYEALADAFVGGPLGTHVAECTRPGGDRVRYNQVTQEYGVLTARSIIRTYLILRGTPAHNRVYFCARCK